LWVAALAADLSLEESAAKADLMRWLYVTAEAVTHKEFFVAAWILCVGAHGFRESLTIRHGANFISNL
jgi:hypothetical protein